MNPLEEFETFCPYCGETIQLLVDTTELDDDFTEDCQVCCRPMVVNLQADGTLRVHREDEV